MTDVQTIGWGGGARWGCKATYSLLMVGGPLDWYRRGLGSVESRRCNWAARKSRLGARDQKHDQKSQFQSAIQIGTTHKCDQIGATHKCDQIGVNHKCDQQVRFTSSINRCDSQVRSTGATHKCDRQVRLTSAID